MMNPLILSLLLVVQADDLPNEIPGAPTEEQAGTLVVLDSSIIPATDRSWLLVNPPSDDNHLALEDGRLIFSTGETGQYQFVLAFKPEGDPETGIHQILHTLTIFGGVKPDPDPGPNPKPNPVLPDGKYKLALLSRNEALKLGKTGAGDIARVYRKIARSISSGNLKSETGKFGERINKATGEALVSSLSSGKIQEWKPWGVAIGTRINELQKEKLLSNDADYLVAYNEIALGLESLQKEDNTDPKPPSKEVAWVIVIEETSDRTPEIAKVITDLKFWNELGVKWRHYDDDAEEAQDYLDELDSVPGVLFIGKEGEIIKTIPLPKTTKDLASELKKLGV